MQARITVTSSETKFRQLFENAQVGILGGGLSDRSVLLANQKMAELLGYENAADLIANFRAEDHWSNLSERTRLFDAAERNQSVQKFEIEGQKLDGSPFFLEISMVVYPDVDEFEAVGVDITARKNAEARLAENQNRLRDIARSTSDAFWETDAQHEFTSFHAFIDNLLVIEPDDIIGKTRWGLAGADVENDPLWRDHKSILDSHLEFHDFEYVLIVKDGQEYHRRSSGVPVFDEKTGDFKGYRGSASDISGRALALKGLQESEERFRALASISADWFWETDADQNTTKYYGATDEIDRSQTVGKPRWEFISDTERNNVAKWKNHKADLAAHRPFRDLEYESSLRDGFWLSSSGEPWYHDDGSFAGYRGSTRNITRQREVDLRARESAHRYRELVDSLPDAIVIHQGGTILFANHGAAEFFGAGSPGEVTGVSITDLIHPSSAELSAQRVREFLDTGQSEPIAEIVFLRFDGTAVTAEARTRQVHWNGEPAIQSVLRDVTEQNTVRQQLAQAQKMEAVGHLTGGIAHDFNNLLQVMSGAALMSRELVNDPDKIIEWLERIEECVLRGRSLTGQLLAFSRQQALTPVNVDPRLAVSGIEELLQRTIGEDVRLSIISSKGMPEIHVDQSGLQNALINLCINSRAAMPDGGDLTIKISAVDYVSDIAIEGERVAAGRFIEIAVLDTGTGMTQAVVNQAFNPFFTTKDVNEGSGLGLSMVYGFARQSGGVATIESAPGEGACVRLLLPVAVEEAVPETQTAAPASKMKFDGTILVAEDDPDVLITTCMMLKSMGWQVVEANDGVAAQKILEQRNDIDILMSDVVMPGGTSGFDLVEALQSQADAPKVLLVSGYPDKVAHADTSSGLIVPLLKKPFSLAQLETALRSIISPDAAS